MESEKTTSKLVLKNLLIDEEYTRTVIPFLKKEYFERTDKLVFDLIIKFVVKYNKLPSPEALLIELSSVEKLSDDSLADAQEIIESFRDDKERSDFKWLIDTTEKWCQDRAIYLAIMESISIIDGSHATLQKNALPDLLTKALAVEFDSSVGHDYINDAENRYNFYHKKEDRIPFDLDYMNRITKGGLPRKTLNILLAGTGVGKSLFMCHHAAHCLTIGKNVLYITLEMAEERIAERIDANLMNVAIDQLDSIDKQMYESKIQNICKKNIGKLIIKEYPTASAHTGHFRALLNELKLKKAFLPDIIFIDYLNICSSSRMKGMGGSINSYSFIKSIAEEIRGLAVEFNVPIFSATQTTRSGFSNTDVELTDTSESFGLPATADLMFAVISTEELEKQNQVMVKQLKNRYNDIVKFKRFILGIDRSKMRLYDVEDKAQTLVVDTTLPSAQPPVLVGRPRKDFSSFKT